MAITEAYGTIIDYMERLMQLDEGCNHEICNSKQQYSDHQLMHHGLLDEITMSISMSKYICVVMMAKIVIVTKILNSLPHLRLHLFHYI